jgi:hypothetical protein
MNASEDIQDYDMNEENPQRLSAVVRKCSHAELEGDDDDGEAFDFFEVDAMRDLSDEPVPVKPKVIERSSAMKDSDLLEYFRP